MAFNQPAIFAREVLNDTEILSVSGEVDISNKDQLDLALQQGLARPPKSFIVNLVELTYADSTCIQALIRAHQTAKNMNKSFAIVIKKSSAFNKILQVAGLLETFDVRYS